MTTLIFQFSLIYPSISNEVSFSSAYEVFLTGINLGFRNDLLLSGYPITVLWEFLVSPTHTTCCAHRDITVNVYFYTATLKFVRLFSSIQFLHVRCIFASQTNFSYLATCGGRSEVYRIGSDDRVIKWRWLMIHTTSHGLKADSHIACRAHAVPLRV